MKGAVLAEKPMNLEQDDVMMMMDDDNKSPSTSYSKLGSTNFVIKTVFDDLELATTSMYSKTEFRNDDLPSEIMKNLRIFREHQDLCDVELEIEDDVIKAHRYVLAAASPYFRAMFTNGMAEMRKTKIELNDISKESLRQLIDFIYTNEITITTSNVQNLLFASSILQMDDIVGACQQFLTKTITLTNCIGLHQFAEFYNCTQLLDATDDFAVDHFRDVRLLPNFNHISHPHLRSILTRADLNVSHESEVFETVINWIETDKSNRLEHLPDLISTVRLPLLGCQYLLDVVKPLQMINDHTSCRDLVTSAIFQLITPPPRSHTDSITRIGADGEGGGEYTAPHHHAPHPTVSAATLHRWQPRKSVAGIVFCAGGRGTLGDPFRSVEAYDWRKDQWFQIADMTIQRRHVGVVSAGDRVYAIGGHDGNDHLASAEYFEPSAGAWKQISPMQTARRGIAVAALDQAIYAVGGLDDSSCFRTVERYDIELDTWTQVAKMTTMRGGVGVTVIGNYLYAIGGNDGSSSLETCERFDPILDRWRLIASMQNRRAGAGICVLDGQLYAIGGFDDNAPLSTCERYDPHCDQWTMIGQMATPRGGVGVASMGGRVYAIGGHDGSKYLNTVESYDPITNTWSTVNSIKECRAGAGVTWADYRMDQLNRVKYDNGYLPSSQCI